MEWTRQQLRRLFPNASELGPPSLPPPPPPSLPPSSFPSSLPPPSHPPPPPPIRVLALVGECV
eukprot:328237-Rhodomonas_salina.1